MQMHRIHKSRDMEKKAAAASVLHPVETIANDVHSRLNATRHKEVIKVDSGSQVQHLLTSGRYNDWSFSIAGGRHSMGGQQFLSDGILLDTSQFNRVVHFCPENGLLTVQAGMFWGDLVKALAELNREHGSQWSIIQKPTGADNISVGGSLASNIHGRVLGRKPFAADVERFTAILANGKRVTASRHENCELFHLSTGGYGLFCFVEDITIRLMKNMTLQRIVELQDSKNLVERFTQLQQEGALYGDFQFCIDSKADSFLTSGILSSYFPVKECTADNTTQLKLSEDDWKKLLRLAHTDKESAFRLYRDHYQRTNGQIYSSETFQLSLYVPDYHDSADLNEGSEMITELYVPRQKLHLFLQSAKEALTRQSADVIYGTIRMIERDDESFLAWAKDDFACIIFNLHVNHDQLSILRSKNAFRTLIDIALSMSGSYYLTYHRYATRKQLLTAYPQFKEFVQKKLEYDPYCRFKSNWFNQICLQLSSH